MTRHRITRRLLPLGCALALGACGGGDPSPGAPAPGQAPSTQGGQRCDNVKVAGHEAVDIQATGLRCDIAEEVAASAEGRGRQPYEAAGFACEPAEAGGGDTSYSCSMGFALITFRYGTT